MVKFSLQSWCLAGAHFLLNVIGDVIPADVAKEIKDEIIRNSNSDKFK